MKLHHLRYFAVLAEELHFGRAAQRLSMTQPPLSNAIRALEDSIGARLLERDNKQVRLTAAGAALLQEVGPILDRIANASQLAQAVASGLRGRLDIGVTGSMLYRGAPAIVQRFTQTTPGVELTLHEMSSAEQLQCLQREQLHAGFVNARGVGEPLQALALTEDPFVVCLPDAHRLARTRAVALKRLAQEPFVMFSRDVAPAYHDNVLALFERAGIQPRTVHAARQWLTVMAMVAQGLGIALAPQSLAQSRFHGVRFVKLSGTGVTSPALFVWNPNHLSPALHALVDAARAHTRSG